MIEIATATQLEDALSSPRVLLLKHSGRCGVSTRAFAQLEEFLDESEAPAGFIDVLAHRPLSDRVEAITGVPHASPQVLLLENGHAIWSATHFDIAVASLREAFRS